MVSIKFFGIKIDSNIDFFTKKKVYKTSGILCKARYYCVSPKLLRMFYQTLIYPHLHYGNILEANTISTRLNQITVIRKKIIRIIT